MLAKIEEINEVTGFDPAPFAVDFTDLNTGEVRKRLPVIIQIAWYRMKYPDGKISVHVSPAKDCFVATARIYPHYKLPEECYLAEATASRGVCEDKPSVSPREWAQTAAVGIALRNAGFGLQFAMAGEDFGDAAADELGIANELPKPEGNTGTVPGTEPMQAEEEYAVFTKQEKELSEEEKLQNAMQVPCPIVKFGGKTLGEVLRIDPGAIKWVATKFTGGEEIKEAARRICDYAIQSAAV